MPEFDHSNCLRNWCISEDNADWRDCEPRRAALMEFINRVRGA